MQKLPRYREFLQPPARPGTASRCFRASYELARTLLPKQGTRVTFAREPMKESRMNWDRIEGNWKQLKGKVKKQWGKLTDDHLDVIAGNRDELAGKLQEAYGVSKDEAERQIKTFEDLYQDRLPDATPHPSSEDPARQQPARARP
jgi:uncharacterized protein YjbJ (UPF0337 family)